MLINYNLETNEIYNMNGQLANPTLIRQEMAKLLRLSFTQPLIMLNGTVRPGGNLVDLVAEYYGLDRHELGNVIGRLQLTALLADKEAMEELDAAHGVGL